jgi:hypothetical protein
MQFIIFRISFQLCCVGVFLHFLLNLITFYTSIMVCQILPHFLVPTADRREVRTVGEGGDIIAHVHST